MEKFIQYLKLPHIPSFQISIKLTYDAKSMSKKIPIRGQEDKK